MNLTEQRLSLLTDHVEELRTAFKTAKSAHPFFVDAILILPDHRHIVRTLPDGDSDYSNRWREIKGCFSRSMPKDERGIGQRRYWEHTIRIELDDHHHTDYLHFNPVKHGHCDRISEWSFSSFHFYVEKGVYPENWGFDLAHLDNDVGQPSES